MIQLTDIHTAFFTAFLSTLLHSLWIGALLYAILRAFAGVEKTRIRISTYKFSVIILFTYMLSFTGIFVYLFQVARPLANGPEAAEEVNIIPFLLLSAQGDGRVSAHFSLINISFALYFAGVLLFTIRLLLASLRIHREIRMGSRVEQEFEMLLSTLLDRTGIGRKVKLMYSKSFVSPALFGLFKPVIVVPTGLLTNLSFAEVEVILMHELFHLKRLDFLVNLVQHFLEIIFFFNPFVWLISSRIRIEREKECDDAVVHFTNSPEIYARALYNLSLLTIRNNQICLAATGSEKKLLLNRIQRILNPNHMKKTTKTRLQFLPVILFIVLLSIGLTGFNTSLLTIDRNNSKEISIDHLGTPKKEKTLPAGTNKSHIADIEKIYTEAAINRKMIPALPDTLTEEQREELIRTLEFSLQELQSIKLEEEFAELEKMKQEILSELPEKLKQEQFRLQQELKSIDEERIKEQMERARLQLDSLHENIDLKEIQEEILREQEIIARQLMEADIHDENLRKQLDEARAALDQVDLDEIGYEIARSLSDLDFDFDFDYDVEINMDSILMNMHSAIQDIDIEAIKKEIDQSIKDLETKIEEIKKNNEGGDAKKYR